MPQALDLRHFSIYCGWDCEGLQAVLYCWKEREKGDAFAVTTLTKRILPLLLILALSLSWLPRFAHAQETGAAEETAASEETLPQDTGIVPPETEAVTEETLPPETTPGETVPKETVPEETLPEETAPETTIPETMATGETVPPETAALATAEPEPLGPGLYFGQLHSHSSFSDGSVTPEEAYAAAVEQGLDYLALTDSGDSLTGADWAAGKSAAEAGRAAFAGLYGYEMNWPARMQIGHIGVLGSESFQSWQAGYDAYDGALERYYAAMAAAGAVGQFNHPGDRYGSFQEFSLYSEGADSFMELLETDGDMGQYVQALDAGWHIAPSWAADSRDGEFGRGRTAVYADSLTEEGLLNAVRRHRVYATADADLEIGFALGGFSMGETAEERALGETAVLTVSLLDPTDRAAGRVEVITEGGAVLDSRALDGASGTAEFSLSTEHPYYFLRVTQPDGDVALTAPVWISHTEDLGIAAFGCETALPVQNEEFTLTLQLYNREKVDFLAEALEILADGNVIFADPDVERIPAGADVCRSLTLTCGCLGRTAITARLTGTLEGQPRVYEAELILSFRQSGMVTDILVDGSHGNAGTDELTLLAGLAAQHDIRVRVAEEITADDLKNCRFLVISAPEEPLTQTFLELVCEYAGYGGSLILCGRGNGEEAVEQLNLLLASVGASLRLRPDALAVEEDLYADTFNRESPWCAGITPNQVYRFADGCSVDAGGGQWLVKTGETVLLACEELITGGTVFAAGSLFLSDASVPEPEHTWKEAYANRSILRNLLEIGGETLPLSTVAEARGGEPGGLFRIRGYVTAGTSNPGNTFPETVYLQDDTGGIAVMPFAEAGIRVGTPMELTGYVQEQAGNRVLKPISREILDAARYQYLPRTGSWKNLLDYEKNGGLLVEVEGECTGLSFRADGTVSGVVLKNGAGQTARVLVEEGIFSGASGKNTLHEILRKGRTVRAAGLLHIDESGETVIRVRNCDEVVDVPPDTYINPKTGDPVGIAVAGMALSGAALLLLKRKKEG